MAVSKSPGQVFQWKLKTIIIQSLKKYIQKDYLMPLWNKESTLLHKTGKDKIYIDNMRQITLLNLWPNRLIC